MRGSNTYKIIVKNERPTGQTQKGRNNILLMKRNECLVARYYYYGCAKNRCYEEIVRLLVNEFYLSPSTIAYIIQDHAARIQEWKHKDPSIYHLQTRWPHLKW